MLMIKKNSVVKIQNLVVNYESRHVKSNLDNVVLGTFLCILGKIYAMLTP